MPVSDNPFLLKAFGAFLQDANPGKLETIASNHAAGQWEMDSPLLPTNL